MLVKSIHSIYLSAEKTVAPGIEFDLKDEKAYAELKAAGAIEDVVEPVAEAGKSDGL